MNNYNMKLEVKVISARNVGEKNVYAKIYIDGEPSTEKQTTVDQRGKKNPKWDFTVAYPINKLDVKDNCTKLTIRLYGKKERVSEDKFIGEVNIKFKELFKRAGKKRKTVKYKVMTGSGKSKGKLKFSYKFLADKPSICGCTAMLAILRLSVACCTGFSGSN
jgi:Ca2+-dependent lipid-binding protein